jgi:hypothetical protein
MPLIYKDEFKDDDELCRVLAAMQVSHPKSEPQADRQRQPSSLITGARPRRVIVDDSDGYSSLEHTPGIEFWVPNDTVTNTPSKL